MAGLILGIRVRAPAGWHEPVRAAARPLRMVLEELPPHRDSLRTVGVAFSAPGETATARSPGPTLVVRRGEPTDVTVINRLAESAAIHWHGIELESWSDGVAGWSGDGPRVAPSIEPGDSFVARLTLPRAGTFIYHTHMHDLSQVTSGLYGSLVVLEPGAALDPARDHVVTVGMDGLDPAVARMVANGDTTEAPLEIALGAPQRFRLVNIGPAGIARFSLSGDSLPVPWRVIARDGADLPAHQIQARPATVLGVGMTADAEWQPAATGEYVLSIQLLAARAPFYRRRIVVR
jgi:FtsP/CotA-like multicopper oxidase with cupredoxin domain